MQETVGLVGIGLAGTALAERFLAAGLGVVGYDIDRARCAHLEALGGTAVGSAAAVARASRRVVLSLLTTEIVRSVVSGQGGLLEARPLPEYVIDTTTGDPDETVAVGDLLALRGVDYLDATLSGSSQQIRAGEAVVMVGATPNAFAACADLLGVVGRKVFHVGPIGSGCKAKLATNLVLGLNRLALAEGLVFAEQIGLQPGPVLGLLMASLAYSAIMESKGPKMVASEFEPQARLRQHHKDVSIILEYAQRMGQELPLSEAHLEVLRQAIEAGDGDLDNSAVIRQLRRLRNKTGSVASFLSIVVADQPAHDHGDDADDQSTEQGGPKVGYDETHVEPVLRDPRGQPQREGIDHQHEYAQCEQDQRAGQKLEDGTHDGVHQAQDQRHDHIDNPVAAVNNDARYQPGGDEQGQAGDCPTDEQFHSSILLPSGG